MNDFKEWLSDYLRYFLLLLAAILTFFLIVIGVRVYKAVASPVMEDPAVVLTETDQLVQTELVTVKAIDTETELETNTDMNDESDLSTEQASEISLNIKKETVVRDLKCEVHDTSKETVESELLQESAIVIGADSESEDDSQTIPSAEVQSIPETELQTKPQTETEYIPVYKTLIGSCYIRSGPSMEADIIGEYMYGTTVEFLEDVGGWYKVRIDGMTGYMGARFF